jgi:prepilin-type N-terminal cleavage/methylation domain-containing protein
MKIPRTNKAFTLIELLVVISIIAILAGIALPVFSSVQTKGAQTKALSNAKQIGLACKLFATDNNGQYPSKTVDPSSGRPTNADVTSSNAAFAQLFPDYLQSEQIFFQAKSAFTTKPPDDKLDSATGGGGGKTLDQGENHWAYVLNLTDSSNASFPLIADGFEDPNGHTYSTDETQKGGVWRAKAAIVIRVDASGKVEKVAATKKVKGGPNDDDLFKSATDWLGASNTVVNPL